MKGNSQSGAVFYYILLAVVLVAAISYAVTSNNRSAVGTLSKDQARVAANEIIEQGNTFAYAVQKIKLRGFGDNDISFANTAVSGYDNTRCTSEACELFNLNGGALNFPNSPSGTNAEENWGFSGNPRINGLGDGHSCTASTPCAELVAFLPNINENVCRSINEGLGLYAFSDPIPADDSGATLNRIETATPIATSGVIINTGLTTLEGKNQFCIQLPTGAGNAVDGSPHTNAYFYFHVLIAG